MKRPLSTILILSILLTTFSLLAGCTNISVGNKKEPSVLTDLFDGDKKVWFYIDDDSLTYDSDILAVLVTENKRVTNFYYILSANPAFKYQFLGNTPNPFSSEPFTLSDFEGLSDDEIINKVSNAYGDASKDYSLTYAYVDVVMPGKTYTLDDYKNREDVLLSKYTLPYTIKYKGDLDSSGNGLQTETLSFLNDVIKFKSGKGNATYNAKMINCKYFTVSSIIKPTEIKDKSYIGIANNSLGTMIISSIQNDDPTGISEW